MFNILNKKYYNINIQKKFSPLHSDCFMVKPKS